MRHGGGRKAFLGALLLAVCLLGAACSDSSKNDSVEAIDAEVPETSASPPTSVSRSTLNVASVDQATATPSATTSNPMTSKADTETVAPAPSNPETAGSTSTTANTTSTESADSKTLSTEPTSTTPPTTQLVEATTTATNTTTPAAKPEAGDKAGELHVRAGAPDGGNGSSQRPFSTLEAGIRAVGPGETLIVHGGEYRERINIGSGLATGSASAPVTITAAQGERPVVRGKLWLRRMSYWTIDGINVTWDAERNTSNEHMVSFAHGNNWTYQNSEVWGARSYAGVLVGGNPVNWTLRGLHIHDTYPANDTNQDHLIYCNCGNGGGLIERNLLVGSKNGRAIKVGTVGSGDANISNLTIRYNTMVDNTGPSNVQLSYRTSGVTIERNVFVGVKAGRSNVTTHELTGSGNVVRNNVGWGSASVVEADPGLSDGGGNLHSDPALDRDYRPTAGAASGYGHRGG